MAETKIYKSNILNAIEDVANWRATMETKLEKLPAESPEYKIIELDLNKCWYMMEDIDQALEKLIEKQ